MDPNLRAYVIKYSSHLMTESEKRAYNHLAGALKATHGRSDVKAQKEAAQHRSFSRMMSDDPEVLDLAKNGWPHFLEQTANRILDEHREEMFFNTCPQCHALARTPTARQCRVCGHDWHKALPGKDAE